MFNRNSYLLICFLCLLLINPLWTEKAEALEIGDDFPSFFLKDINGNDFFLKEYTGEKAKNNLKGIIFSFCASYCEPCKKENPELAKLMEKLEGKGLGIFLVALEKEDLAQKLVEETKTTFPVLIDKHLIVQKLIGFVGIPYTVLIDSNRKVRYIGTSFSEDDAEEIMGRLEHAVLGILGTDSGDTDQ